MSSHSPFSRRLVSLVVIVTFCGASAGRSSSSVGFELSASVPSPSVNAPVEGETPGEAKLNDLLMGALLEDAVTVLEKAGWAVRPRDLDNPDVTLTAELGHRRVTVEHRDGRVVRTVIG